jgi:hypothetical protein
VPHRRRPEAAGGAVRPRRRSGSAGWACGRLRRPGRQAQPAGRAFSGNPRAGEGAVHRGLSVPRPRPDQHPCRRTETSWPSHRVLRGPTGCAAGGGPLGAGMRSQSGCKPPCRRAWATGNSTWPSATVFLSASRAGCLALIFAVRPAAARMELVWMGRRPGSCSCNLPRFAQRPRGGLRTPWRLPSGVSCSGLCQSATGPGSDAGPAARQAGPSEGPQRPLWSRAAR